jgi:hypothetical protein
MAKQTKSKSTPQVKKRTAKKSAAKNAFEATATAAGQPLGWIGDQGHDRRRLERWRGQPRKLSGDVTGPLGTARWKSALSPEEIVERLKVGPSAS